MNFTMIYSYICTTQRSSQPQSRVVPLRKELTISRIIDNPSEMMTNWVLPNNTEVLNLIFGVIAQ